MNHFCWQGWASLYLVKSLRAVKGVNDLVSYIGELATTSLLKLEDNLAAPLMEQVKTSIDNFPWGQFEDSAEFISLDIRPS